MAERPLAERSATSADSAASLPRQVRGTRERLTALLSDVDPDGAAWVERVRTARPATPTVVVVGETNRGKSSLVNALVATPGLSPVDAAAATAGYVVLRHGEQWSARAQPVDAPEPVPVSMADLPRWVVGVGADDGTVADPDDTAPVLPPVRFVEVCGPVPLLERLTLVDTPGMGGLDQVHGELAAEAAESATALLFVLDASAPITRGELDFLSRLGDRVETVLFALTKTDAHRGWREVLAADRSLLAAHAPRFADAPVHPVSARLFETAASASSPQVATLLREQSGVAALQSVLQHRVAGRAAMLGEANTLRALATVLASAVVRHRRDEEALRDPESGQAAAEALRVRRDELATARRSSTRGWQLRLRGHIQRARVESTHEVAGLVRGAQARLRAAIDAADRPTLRVLPARVDAELQVMSGQVGVSLSARVTRVVDAALDELFTPDELAVIRAQFARRDRPPVVLRPPDERPGTAEDKLLVAMGFSGGLGLGRLAALPLVGLGAAAGAVVLPVSLVLGLGAGWWMARTRRHAADKTHLRQWLADVMAESRSVLDQTVAEQMIEVEQQLSLALDDALGRRLVAIEDELREVDRSLRLDTAERTRLLSEVRSRLVELRNGRERVDGLLRRIRALRDRE